MADKKLYSVSAAALLTITMSALPAIAATERQLDSHEHGHARINMALADKEVLAELISPAANVVGFEHAPETDEQKKAVEDAAATLAGGEGLLVFSAAAECSLSSVEVESALLGDGDGHDDHDDHDGDKHDDHDDHDGDKHDDHDDHDGDKHDDHDDHDGDKHDDHDDHDHDGHDGEVHSEFHVTWSFSCAHPEDLKTVDVKLFDAFPGFEEIDVSVAGESAQGSFELSPDNSEINL